MSGVAHVLFDLLLAMIILVATVASGTPIIGLALVLLSKWRMVAVRPRYWLLNVKSNLVDLMVGLGVVMLIYHGGMDMGADTAVISVIGLEMSLAQIFWTVVYVVWLVWLKHKTSESMTEAQAIFGVFVGMAAVGMALSSVDLVFSVVANFVIGYGAMRHVLVQSEDYDFTLMTFVVGLMLAELTWVLWHWMIILNYGWTQIRIPQMAVVGTLATFGVMKVYKMAVKHDGKIRVKDVWKAVVFSVFLMVIMLVWLSNPVKNLAR